MSAQDASHERAANGQVGRRRRLRRALVALAASSLCAFLLAEIACRMLYGAPLVERLPLMEVRANPRRGWEMTPSSEHYTYEERVRVNALGLRGPEVGPKAPGETRVLALGDSLVYGQGVGEEDTLPARLERALGSAPAPHPARRWCVVNGGLRAYDTEQEVALCEELVDEVAPDVVVLFWFCNDLDDPDIEGMHLRLARSGPIVFDLGEGADERTLLVWRAKQLLRRSALVMKLHDVVGELRTRVQEPDSVEQGFAKIERGFARLASLARARGIDVLVAAIPINLALAHEHPSEALVARALRLARAAGFATLDLLEPLRALEREVGRAPVIPFDGHYDARANDVMACAVAEALRERFPERFGSAR